MKSNEVGTTLKHPETINGNVKNLSKRMKMKDIFHFHHFYFKNLTLPLITRVGEMVGVGTFLNSTNKAKLPLSAHQNTSFHPPPPPLWFSKFFQTVDFLPSTSEFLAIFSQFFPKKSPKNQPIFSVIFLEKIVSLKKSRFWRFLVDFLNIQNT
jgi:hypothetical protein